MARKLRPTRPHHGENIRTALYGLRLAAECLREANCPRALARVRAALKSTDGARRHLLRREAAMIKPEGR